MTRRLLRRDVSDAASGRNFNGFVKDITEKLWDSPCIEPNTTKKAMEIAKYRTENKYFCSMLPVFLPLKRLNIAFLWQLYGR